MGPVGCRDGLSASNVRDVRVRMSTWIEPDYSHTLSRVEPPESGASAPPSYASVNFGSRCLDQPIMGISFATASSLRRNSIYFTPGPYRSTNHSRSLTQSAELAFTAISVVSSTRSIGCDRTRADDPPPDRTTIEPGDAGPESWDPAGPIVRTPFGTNGGLGERINVAGLVGVIFTLITYCDNIAKSA